MKKILPLLFLAFTIFTATTVEAQSKKELKAEKKKWKKKLKELDPLEYKAFYEDYNSMKGEVGALKREISKLEKQLADAENTISDKNKQISDLQGQLNEIKSSARDVSNTGDDWTKGVVYKVQIGAFKNQDLTKFQETGNFWVEDADGTKKYTIANFRDYWEADEFKKYMRAMGVKDAWIVAYKDNTRTDIKAVISKEDAEKKEAMGNR